RLAAVGRVVGVRATPLALAARRPLCSRSSAHSRTVSRLVGHDVMSRDVHPVTDRCTRTWLRSTNQSNRFLRASENRVYYNGAMPWEGVHALVCQAKAGDARAWEQLVALTRPHLLSVALRVFDRAAPWQSVSDLLQETWIRAWQGLTEFRGGGN